MIRGFQTAAAALAMTAFALPVPASTGAQAMPAGPFQHDMSASPSYPGLEPVRYWRGGRWYYGPRAYYRPYAYYGYPYANPYPYPYYRPFGFYGRRHW